MIIGSGNIGTDLMMKISKISEALSLAAMVGIDLDSEGLVLTSKSGVAKAHEDIQGAMALPAKCPDL